MRRSLLVYGMSRSDSTGFVELLELLVKVFAKRVALDEGRMGLGELFAVEFDKDGLDVIDELVDP